MTDISKTEHKENILHILCCYLSHESEQCCSHTNGTTRLFWLSDRRQGFTLKNSGPNIQSAFQRLTQL